MAASLPQPRLRPVPPPEQRFGSPAARPWRGCRPWIPAQKWPGPMVPDEGALIGGRGRGLPASGGSVADDTAWPTTASRHVEEALARKMAEQPAASAAAAFCRAIEPVTESSPCSSTVTREYSRSRSPFSVSMADASRRVSFWLSLAIDWICCDCRARSAARPVRAAIRSRTGWQQRDDDSADRAHAPRSRAATASAGRIHPPRPKSRTSKPPAFSVSKLPARLVGIPCHATFRPSRGPAKSHGKH